MLRSIFAAAVLSVFLASSAFAGPLEDAAKAYKQGDYTIALNLWRPLAEQGTPIAQYNLGRLYAGGEGVTQDYAEALHWLRLSADRGYASAQYNLGLMYGTGEGVPQDYEEALRWYRLAAEQGYAPAQNNLGFMYKRAKVCLRTMFMHTCGST